MQSAIERMFVIFQQMTGQAELNDDLRKGAEEHVRKLSDAGEVDEQRLIVGGLTYLKQHHEVDA